MKHIYFYRLVIYLIGMAIVAVLYLHWQDARELMDIMFCAVGKIEIAIWNFIGNSLEMPARAHYCVKYGRFSVIAVVVIFVWGQTIKRK